MEHGERVAQLSDSPHLWLLTLDSALDSPWVAERESLLSAEEDHRYRRYLRVADRELFLAAHVFVRETLSLYAPIAPADWTFVTNQYGRPEIANAESPLGLRFNLAHTSGMVALLVHDQADGGVDIEHLGNVADPLTMSKSVFAETERRELLALTANEQEDRFYDLWTLKEAFIKAKGKGLAMPLKDFAFADVDRPEIRVECGPEIDPEPDAWHFTVRRPSPQFVVATAYRAERTRSERSISVFEA